MFVRSFVVSILLAIPGCGAGELAPLPATHPASAQAEEAPLPTTPSALASVSDATVEAPDASHAHGHEHVHAHGPSSPASPSSASGASPASATQGFVCPMHAEVTSQAPGECPKCGMKLVPAKKP